MKVSDATLQLNANLDVIGSISDFTYRWSINAGLGADDAVRLSQAVDELVTDIVLFAYPDPQIKGKFEINLFADLTKVIVTITEDGEPFDPDYHTYDPEKAILEGKFEGAGFELIKYLTDEFTFHNLGRKGKEYKLSKNIVAPSKTDILPTDEPEAATVQLKEIEFHINPVQPEDAEDIAKLIYRCYGRTYPKEDVYFPKKIETAFFQHKKIGVLARTADGEPAGFFAVIESTDSNIGEVGEAVVGVNFRRRGLFKRMMAALIEVAKHSGLQALFGEAIAVHEISQRVNHEFGYETVAIFLAAFPAVSLRGFKDEYPQPVSEILEFLPLVDIETRKAFLPAPYQKVLSDIYYQLEVHIDDTPPKGEYISPPNSEIDISMNYNKESVVIIARSIGYDFVERVQQHVVRLGVKDVNCIYIDLPLHDYGILEVVQPLREMGFIFSGLVPLFHQEKDYLRMQMVLVEMDLDLVVTYSPMSKEILEIIREELDGVQV